MLSGSYNSCETLFKDARVQPQLAELAKKLHWATSQLAVKPTQPRTTERGAFDAPAASQPVEVKEDEAVEFVTGREKPLALYYFGPEAAGLEILRRTSSGGACLNDTIMHIANDQLPFGGVGNSGMGRYHGRESFDAFSHRRALVCAPQKFDLPFRYPPYKGFRWVKKIL